MRFLLLLLVYYLAVCVVRGQTPYDSDSIIKYDYETQTVEGGKPIPFDRPFTLNISNLPVSDVQAVHAYEARYVNGRREGVKVVLDILGNVVTARPSAVKQLEQAALSQNVVLTQVLNKAGKGVLLTLNERTVIITARAAAYARSVALAAVLVKYVRGKKITCAEAKAACLADAATKHVLHNAEVRLVLKAMSDATAKATALSSVISLTRIMSRELTVDELDAAAKPDLDISDVKDYAPLYDTAKGGLTAYFPALKPNKVFDLHIIQKLPQIDKNALLDINSLISQGKPEAKSAFSELYTKNLNPYRKFTALRVDYRHYNAFFQKNLSNTYQDLSDREHFDNAAPLPVAELRAIGALVHSAGLKPGLTTDRLFQRMGAGVEIFKAGLSEDIQLGLINVAHVYQRKHTDMAYLHTRLSNLAANLTYSDSLHQLLNAALISNVAPLSAELKAAQLHLTTVRSVMRMNYDRLSSGVKEVQGAIDRNDSIREVVTVSGGTLAVDLKSAGGSVLFLDAGLTNIVAPGLQGGLVYLPRLYSGVSIYFRPVDKNTRRNRFPRHFDPPLQRGRDGTEYGPDYGIVSHASVWQHLSLNLGFTFGSFPNKDFDNFYNNTSLLIGPAYRFARAFKVSTGLVLLKRTSKHPEIAEKTVIPGAYASLSVDVDFIQGLKDVTSLLFK